MATEQRGALSGLLALVFLVSLAGPAQAAPPAARPDAEADALFREGRALFDAHRYAEACTKLAASDRRSPSVKTLGLLAGCHEQQGKLVAAWHEYQETADRALAAHDAREGFALERVAALRKRVPSIRLQLTEPAPGEHVSCNGAEVAADDADDLRVDPGLVTIEVNAPGRLPWSTSLTAAEGVVDRITVPALVKTDGTSGAAPAVADPDATSPLRVAGLVAGGLGIAGLAVGGVFGVMAIGRNSASKEGPCNFNNQCTPEGGMIRDQARSFAAVSTVGVVGGGVAVAAGVLLLLAARPAGKPVASVRLVPGFGGAALDGTF